MSMYAHGSFQMDNSIMQMNLQKKSKALTLPGIEVHAFHTDPLGDSRSLSG